MFEDGSGGGWERGGVVDIREARLTLDGVVFSVDHDRNDMDLVTNVTSYDFGSGEESASAYIVLRRC